MLLINHYNIIASARDDIIVMEECVMAKNSKQAESPPCTKSRTRALSQQRLLTATD